MIGAGTRRHVPCGASKPFLPSCVAAGHLPRDAAPMTSSELLDAAGRRRSPATPGFQRGRPPRNKGRSYPADGPTAEEIVAVMRYAGGQTSGLRTRALIVLLWRAGLRINEAPSLAKSDLDPRAASFSSAEGRGPTSPGRHGRLGMGASQPLAGGPTDVPVGALLCVVSGPTAGRPGGRRLACGRGPRVAAGRHGKRQPGPTGRDARSSFASASPRLRFSRPLRRPTQRTREATRDSLPAH